ncbi:long-chain-fatty-acid--CoA ligase 4-like [Pollicipes pollicipes]|uniref:long-chain-fatty-acid--CoA ligase 4-like n=1 Tax=Pollicipes pollicipes TaxID=41117 RepID=UPI001885375F|nr:long-chain-fatty-acid--CoA ligase 4-like [Pollicipes pollicipes]
MAPTMKDRIISAAVFVISGIVMCYDIITIPIYCILQWPWVQVRKAKKIRARPVPNASCRYHNYDRPSGLQLTVKRLQLDTVEKIVRYAITKHAKKPCLGVREILGEENEKQPNGKVFKKFSMGEFRWVSYVEFAERAEWFGRALREVGLQPGDRLVIFAETRAEWLIAAVGAFFQNITVVTLYATLGEDAIVHGISETEVTHVVTSHDLIKKIQPVLAKCDKVTHLVYMKDQLSDTDVSGIRDGIRTVPFPEMLKIGQQSSVANNVPTSKDIAIIMYTSGSTGTPKGVLLSHHNMVTTMVGFAVAVRVNSDDVYLGYLPLAHVLELMAEMCCIMFGVPIGYSSPLTLMDSSSKVKRGCRGDSSVLRPTMMAAVPMVLDRVAQGLEEKMQASGPFVQALFRWAVQYRNTWRRRGFDTPILHQLLFSRIAALLGGRIRAMASGGAPLSEVTHDMIRSCIGTRLHQGYGLTETTASATLMDEDDLSVGRVGHPVNCCDIKLVDWEEGNYRIADQPRPRGEIVIGGDNVAMGYYKLPEKTEESFYEENGCRWFRTGDIGEMYPNGTLKIIDRKKDLVKLQSGEYVSLGRVETVLKTSPLVENMFVFAEPTKAHVVAIVLPNIRPLQQLAKTTCGDGGGDGEKSLDDLCSMPQLEKEVQKALAERAKQGRLDKFEIPTRVGLTSVVWTPDNNLVTAAFKLKRKELSNFYREELSRLYQ